MWSLEQKTKKAISWWGEIKRKRYIAQCCEGNQRQKVTQQNVKSETKKTNI